MTTRTVKKCLYAVLILGLLASGGYGGYCWYMVLRQTHLIQQARQFLIAFDLKDALLCLERALQHNPKDPNACRLMADYTEATHSPSALIWRSRVVEYNPSSLDDRLALAQTAIRQGDHATATRALDGVNQAAKNTASFHSVAGELAVSINQLDVAETHFREAAPAEADQPIPLLNLAALQLEGSNAPAVAEGWSFLQKLASNPTNAGLRWNALRELTLASMLHRATNESSPSPRH